MSHWTNIRRMVESASVKLKSRMRFLATFLVCTVALAACTAGAQAGAHLVIETTDPGNELLLSVVSPDKQFLFTSRGTSPRLWDIQSQMLTRTFPVDSAINAIAYSSDGKRVAAFGVGALLWDVRSGRKLVDLKNAFGDPGAGDYGNQGGGAYRWNGGDERVGIHSIVARSFDRNGYRGGFSPDGQMLVVAAPLEIHVFDAVTGLQRRSFPCPIGRAAILPDNRTLAAVCANGIFVWNLATGKLLWAVRQYFEPLNRSRVFFLDGLVAIEDVPEEPKPLEGGPQPLQGNPGSPRVWDLATGVEPLPPLDRVPFQDPQSTRHCEGVTQDSWVTNPCSGWSIPVSLEKWARHAASDDRIASYVELADSGLASILEGFVGEQSTPAVSRILKTPFPQATKQQAGYDYIGDLLRFSESGDTLTLGDNSSTDRKSWDLASGNEITPLDVGADLRSQESEYAVDMASHDGRMHAVIPHDVFDPAKYISFQLGSRELLLRRGANDDVAVDLGGAHPKAVAFSPDDRVLAVSCDDDTVRFLDTRSAKQKGVLVLMQAGGWVVVDAAGRFDSNALESNLPFHWVFDSHPMAPVSLVHYMRRYFTPGLMASLLGKMPPPAVPLLVFAGNMSVPEVSIVSVKTTDHGRFADVLVHLTSEKQGKSGTQSGAYDLKLFRDNQNGIDKDGRSFQVLDSNGAQLVGLREGALRDGAKPTRTVSSHPASSGRQARRSSTATARNFGAGRILGFPTCPHISFSKLPRVVGTTTPWTTGSCRPTT